MGQKVADLFFAVLPFIAGVIVGGARRLWWIHAVHDTVLRYAYLQKDENHATLRGVFCATINGRRRMIDAAGREVGGLSASAWFYGAVFLAMAGVLVVLALFTGWFEGSTRFLKACMVGGAAVLWIFFRLSLASSRHRTMLFQPDPAAPAEGPGWKRWKKGKAIRLSAERADDGLPTKSLASN